jgi:hypothetical protein
MLHVSAEKVTRTVEAPMCMIGRVNFRRNLRCRHVRAEKFTRTVEAPMRIIGGERFLALVLVMVLGVCV